MLAIYTYPFIILYTGDTSVVSINDNNDSDIANTTLITGTTIGTTLVVIIILFFTIVIMCVKKKKFRRVTNDSHENKDKCTCYECGDILHCNEMKLETANCLNEPTSIEIVDVPITPNPAYSINPNSIQTGKKLNHQYDYIETGYLELVESTTTEDAHNNNDTNPASVESYSTQDITLQDNPSYVKL